MRKILLLYVAGCKLPFPKRGGYIIVVVLDTQGFRSASIAKIPCYESCLDTMTEDLKLILIAKNVDAWNFQAAVSCIITHLCYSSWHRKRATYIEQIHCHFGVSCL